MKKVQDHQISSLLQVAIERLAYSKYIAAYPAGKDRRNFDTSALLDIFYKNVCNTSFNDSLLMTVALLDKKNKKGVSLWNWRELKTEKAAELTETVGLLVSSGLKGIRDQVVGHVDVGNHNNNFLWARRQGIVDERIIAKLDEIQSKLVRLFFEYTSEIGLPHAEDLFSTSGVEREIKAAMDAAPPTLTDAWVI